jgi:hypothetical protein
MGQILFFLMMALPLGTFPVENHSNWWFDVVEYVAMPYGILWKLESLTLSPNTLWLAPSFLFLAIPVVVLNAIFVFYVVRYYNALTSRKHVITVGFLSFLIPLVYTVLVRQLLPESPAYFGPLPFLLITGLFLLYKIPGPEIRPSEYHSRIFVDSDMAGVR